MLIGQNLSNDRVQLLEDTSHHSNITNYTHLAVVSFKGSIRSHVFDDVSKDGVHLSFLYVNTLCDSVPAVAS